MELHHAEIPLEKIKLDPTNPRIAHSLPPGQIKKPDIQEFLTDLLWKDNEVQKLYHSVHRNQGLVERITVRSNFVVAEGNCRTVVYRKLQENNSDNPIWNTISAKILPYKCHRQTNRNFVG